MNVDSTARVHPDARIADDVIIGPWTLIEAGVEIGAGCRIDANVIVRGPTRIGRDNYVAPFCSIGDEPQDKKFIDDGSSRLEIGDGNTIREYVSINRGTPAGGGVTRIGDHNWVMAYCHIAHDCQIGNHTVFANNATLAGHVEIGDHAVLGGFTGVHQFCRIGESGFTAISAVVVKDVPPFIIVEGNTARARAINRVGLNRRGMVPETILELKRAFKTLYRRERLLADALAELDETAPGCPEVARMVAFIRATRRGIVR